MPKTPVPQAVADYIQQQPEAQQAMLLELRAIIMALAPGAGEKISYGVPTYNLHGPLVSIGAAAKHCSLYALNATSFGAFKNELSGYSTSKGTVRFPLNAPLPTELIRVLVNARIAENVAKSVM